MKVKILNVRYDDFFIVESENSQDLINQIAKRCKDRDWLDEECKIEEVEI